jgi:hypothetical protein
MNAQDQYKEEAMRLLDQNPLATCSRVAERLNGHGWKVTDFTADVRIFENVQWSVRAKIVTEKTKMTHKQKWEELQPIFAALELSVCMIGMGTEPITKSVSHRKYGYDDIERARIFEGYIHDFFVEFKPARSLELSVLTEEDA